MFHHVRVVAGLDHSMKDKNQNTTAEHNGHTSTAVADGPAESKPSANTETDRFCGATRFCGAATGSSSTVVLRAGGSVRSASAPTWALSHPVWPAEVNVADRASTVGSG